MRRPSRTMKLYAGIGARATPRDVLTTMVELGRLLAARRWTLRTGGARGADTAFLNGCLLWASFYELYAPYPNFSDQAPPTLERPTAAAYEIAARYHPRWGMLDRTNRALHARNVHIILGADCATPVRMVICWTPDGSLDGRSSTSGGTGMALRIARGEAPDAEVFNLARADHRERINRFTTQKGRHAAT